MELNVELLRRVVDDPTMPSRESIAAQFGISDQEARYYWFMSRNMDKLSEFFETDAELVEQNVRFQKQRQKHMDLNRIERKSFREYARVENAVSEYTKQLIEVFQNNPYKPAGVFHNAVGKAFGVVHLSDVHFNELINIKSNKYDFTIASKRIQKFITESVEYLNRFDVVDVFLLMTGDLLNSDRRLDEILAMATNRSKATFIAVQIIENAIVQLNEHYNVHVAGVCGNESRVGKDFNWNGDIVSDNYDFTIFNILRYKLHGTQGVSFLGLSDKLEEVVEVGDKVFLLVHGNQIGKDVSKDMSKLIRKYANMDILIDFVIYGHLHEAMIADMYARSSSVCGSNNYSEDALLLVGKASQNLHVVKEHGIDSVKIDIQDTTGYEGYDTKDWQDAYNPKSLEKTRKHETVLRITI
jgi:predicted phosphodiesterase